ncbi:peptidoglycan DD-metalloendopeptidase family protein [Bacillus tropicus]|uniref:peptidoglycan DD-metalloendopeptidase family protein n=1 Tax=Bacillus tropicus TaxID=2026188 RepID=UPI0008FDC1C4|nr:peptidoglycan DD-metalloendopeptidase family protein [Bacillus tropicus]MDF9555845.1 peptidoglycan DD-metalloendopeptidase family protein [Bacillus tropicus]MDF9588491.1 peptidoglycan DD-metalloendopeptidase family protein [Bacillus tropicus]MDF9645664.1 peptidoglycan DD-metalloendopeptidase family protein [Bacillus tropicus]OJE40608.1 peptidase M23 [Bacillus tropicus]HDR7798215.1 peptidoglycan DD-metalloendopeptidase family protein [Bacillus tropicus]
MKALKYGVMLLIVLFLSQLHVYAEGNQWAWPVEGQISDYFGTRNGKHYGIDIAAPIGTPVSAIQEGKVTKSYYSSSYGNVVFIKHGEYEAVYAHLNKRYVVQGDYISKGEIIGEVGNTGESRGAHLHLEVHQGRWTMAKKNAMNPLLVLHEQRNEAVSSSLYVVQKGDTLVSIARKFRMSVKEIQEKNGLQQELIYPNQQLYVK